jgi:hypothetical protein
MRHPMTWRAIWWQALRAGTFTVTGAIPADGPGGSASTVTMMSFTVAGTAAAAADLTTFTAKVGRCMLTLSNPS